MVTETKAGRRVWRRPAQRTGGREQACQLATPLKALVVAMLVVLFGVLTAHSAAAYDEDFEGFGGSGFAPVPAAGQLDSDVWIVGGLSDGIMAFGDTRTAGDFARGLSTGGVGTGGVFAFDTGLNRVLGIQPGTDDFTPGAIRLRLVNASAATQTTLNIAYKIWYRNDQDRASYLHLAYSLDCTTFVPVPAVDFATPALRDSTPAWQSTARGITLTGLSIAGGAALCLEWSGDDAGGTGSRDEYGIDDVSVSAPTLVELLSYTATVTGGRVTLTWETAVEVDNAGFAIQRALDASGPYSQINPVPIAPQAQPGQGARYEYDDEPGPGTFYYMLIDVDARGVRTEHGPLLVVVSEATDAGHANWRLFLPAIAR